MEVTYEEAVPMDVTNPEHRNGYWFFYKKPEWSNEEEGPARPSEEQGLESHN